jgi:tetratricopeptide (TPR) repeat protein
MRHAAALLGLLVALSVLSLAGAQGAESLTREQALAALQDKTDVEERRAGVAGLGRTGLMDDGPALVQALRDPDAEVRTLAEQSLWQVWSRSGEAEVDALFQQGLEQMQSREIEAAIQTFSEVIRRKPEFAEGWNKRATLYYVRGDLEKSLADCDEVIKRNPIHFGALSGYGLIYLQLGQPERALRYFERALAVDPNLDQIQAAVDALREALGRQQQNST